MIIIKDLPGLPQRDLIHAVADLIPIEEIKLSNGGIVVDPQTAHTILTRYLNATGQTPEDEPVANEPDEKPAPARRGRPRRTVNDGIIV